MNQTARQKPILLAAGCLGLVLVLLASSYAYWQYVNIVPPFVPHLPPVPSPNGYLAAERAARAIQETMPDSLRVRWPEGPPAKVQARLARIQPFLNQVRAQLRYDWSAAPDLLDPGRVPFSGFQECARGFVAESILRWKDGDDPGAMRSALDAAELGARMSKGGTVLHRLEAARIQDNGFGEAERLALRLPGSAVPDSLLRVRRLRNEWALLSETIENQRISTRFEVTQGFLHYRQLSPIQQWRSLSPTGNLSAIDTLKALLTPRRVPIADIDDYYRRLIAECRKPVRQRRSVPTDGGNWAEIVSTVVSTTDPLDHEWLHERPRTELALLEVALAVRMHNLEHGHYPARLTDISKKWLRAIPTDLWDQPVAYRLKNGRPIVYSFGPDGKDDSGLPIDATRLTPTTRGDLVFGTLVRSRARR